LRYADSQGHVVAAQATLQDRRYLVLIAVLFSVLCPVTTDSAIPVG
jgi:hypothetical protein